MATAIAFEIDPASRQGGAARGGSQGGTKEAAGGAFAAMLSQDGGARGKAQHTEGQRAAATPTPSAAGLRALNGLLQSQGEPQDAHALQQVLEALGNGDIPPEALLQELLGDDEAVAALEELAALLTPEEMSPRMARALEAAGLDRAELRDALESAQSDGGAALQALLATTGRESAAGQNAQRPSEGEALRGFQQTADAEAGRPAGRGGAPVEGDIRIDPRTLERMTQENRAVDGRFSGQRVSVSVEGQASASAPQARLSGETALAAQSAQQQSAAAQQLSSVQQAAARLRGEGETTRNGQLREAGTTRADTQSTQSTQTQATQPQTPPTQGQSAQTQGQIQPADALQQQAQPQNPAQTAAENAADTGQTTARGGEGEAAGRGAGGEGRSASIQGQSFDPVMQNNQTSANSQQNTAPAQNHATQQAAQHRPNGHAPLQDQIAVKIQRAAQDGQQRVNIRLNPAELGRIDVKLEMSEDGRVRAMLAVERPETLDMLQRDARGLERALQDAGLKTDGGSLSFDLDGGAGQDKDGARDHADNGGGNAAPGTGDEGGEADEPLPDSAEDVPSPLRLIEDGLDIRV